MKTKEILSYSFSGLMLVCMLVITGLLIYRELYPPEVRPLQPAAQQVVNWQDLELSGQQVGPEDAPVQIIEFFDYECPFCKRAAPAIEAITNKYPREVSVVYEHFPLKEHGYAYGAAIAAECAGLQGVFTPYHKLLFSNQDNLRTISYTDLAIYAEVPILDSFTRCVKNYETAEIVESGKALAEKLSVRVIPTFVINGKLVSGVLTEEQLESFVQQALSEGARKKDG